MAKRIVTLESVKAATDSLIAEGASLTLENIKNKIGGGSFSTICETMKRINSHPAPIQPDEEAKLRPLMSAASQLIKGLSAELSGSFHKEIDQLKGHVEELTGALANCEIALEEALEANESQRKTIYELDADRKKANSLLESSNAELERVKAELIGVRIREADFEMAKTEAAEARDKAARLEGRLEEIELSRTKMDGPNLRKEQAKKR